MSDDVLAGWHETPFTAVGLTHPVLRRGSGPGVVLVPELPGATPEVLRLGEVLVEHGYRVAVPSLFGTPGRPVSPAYVAQSVGRVCVSSEFAAFARRRARPVAEYLRALARQLHEEAGGPGVGVIGMCFTGGFAIAAAVEPAVLAPVASQPSVPFPVSARHRADLGVSDGERDAVAARVRDEGLCLLGLRFSADSAAPGTRFDALRARFGDGFRVIELDSSPGNPHGFARSSHSVLTHETVDQPGPAHDARAEVLAFLAERLQAG